MTPAARTSAVLVVFAIAVSVPSVLGASNLTYRASLDTWSTRIGTDASAVALAARQRHPRLMTAKALAFRRDALHARSVVAAQRISTLRLRKSRAAALNAFASYARSGAEWASSGRLRLAHKRAASIAAAKAGARDAAAGGTFLVAAARLAR